MRVAHNGYNFFCPFEPTKDIGVPACWLMDMEGRFVHMWRVPYPPGAHAILLPNGNVLEAAKLGDADEYGWPGWFGGIGGCLIEIDMEYPTGKVIGRYGRGEIFHQHDARELDNGNILLFDNGTHRHEYRPEYSRIVEIDPNTDKIAWEYKTTPPSDFHSAHSGGCERQPNGNTVIIETDKGRAFEVTPCGRLTLNDLSHNSLDFGCVTMNLFMILIGILISNLLSLLIPQVIF